MLKLVPLRRATQIPGNLSRIHALVFSAKSTSTSIHRHQLRAFAISFESIRISHVEVLSGHRVFGSPKGKTQS